MPAIDIIVPVWNRPVETRACLASLAAESPGARLIMVNNGSDRETECLLEEFAEALDDRALLISSPLNHGFVRGANIGMARAEAELTAVVKQTSLVSNGWLEPLLMHFRARPEIGIAVPRLVPAGVTRVPRGNRSGSVTEAPHGDFAALVIRKELYDLIGGFDEELDGGIWCLKDYSRRARKTGYLVCAVEAGPVIFQDEVALGSLLRRDEIRDRSAAEYARRWGTELSFCIYFPRNASFEAIRQKLEVALQGARQGHTFTLLLFPAMYELLVSEGYGLLHRSIMLHKLPRIFADRRAGTLAASLCGNESGAIMVAGLDEVPFPGVGQSMLFAEFAQLIQARESEIYGGGRSAVRAAESSP